MKQYDIVTIGGGLGGAALARTMAAKGASVLVLERTKEFRDRIRGEVLVPWGCREAMRLGLYDLLHGFANEMRYWEIWLDGFLALRQDLRTESPLGLSMLCFYHPRMQDAVLPQAHAAGAEVRRGATVRSVRMGARPAVVFDEAGESHEVEARLVVGADGRDSSVRKWCGFEERRDPERRFFAGVLIEEFPAPVDVMAARFAPSEGFMSWVFPQGAERARCYIGYHAKSGTRRLQGEGDMPRFIEHAVKLGVPAEWFANAKVGGPLATFDATDNWVERPYREGVALIGDAAATSDPTWGQGLSQTLYDVRALSERLLASADWDAAGAAYAGDHAWCWEAQHTADTWFTDLLLEVGPEADARRARALPLIATDPTRMLNAPVSGPEYRPEEVVRRRFFGEE